MKCLVVWRPLSILGIKIVPEQHFLPIDFYPRLMVEWAAVGIATNILERMMSTNMERLRINIPIIGTFAASEKLVGLSHVRVMRWRSFRLRPGWVEGERCT
jgi:hypothetical protein